MTQMPTTCGHAVLQVLAFAGWMTAKGIADAHNNGPRDGLKPHEVYELYSWKQVRAAISGMGEACARVDRHWVDRRRRTDGGTGYLYRITDAGLRKLRELQVKAILDFETRSTCDLKVGGRTVGTIVSGEFSIDVGLHHADAIPYSWVTSPDRAARLSHLDFFSPSDLGHFNCSGRYVMPKPPMSLFDATTIARKVLNALPWRSLPDDLTVHDVTEAYAVLARNHAHMPQTPTGCWGQLPPADLVEFQWGFPTQHQVDVERRGPYGPSRGSTRQRMRDSVLAACREVFGLSGVEAESLRGLRVRVTLEQYGRFVALVGGSAVALNTRPEIVSPQPPKQEPVDLTGRKG